MGEKFKFTIYFSVYPNLRDVMENFVKPWTKGAVNWNDYVLDDEGEGERGVLSIEEEPETFLELMDYLYTVLESDLKEFAEEWEITDEHLEELACFEEDFLALYEAACEGSEQDLCNLHL